MLEEVKKRARDIVQRRPLYSCMNNTKWTALRRGMLYEMPFPPPHIRKSLFEDACPEERHFQTDVDWLGDWNESFLYDAAFPDAAGWFSWEWIKVRPCYLKNRGRLIAPERVDASELFEAILERHRIPCEKTGGVYCIYGYRAVSGAAGEEDL